MVIRILTRLLYTVAVLGVVIFILSMPSCGEFEKATTKSERIITTSAGCTVEQVEEGALITCPDGSKAEVYNGSDGVDGDVGQDGTSCTVTEFDGGADINCNDGSSVLVFHGEIGENGTDGINGEQGEKGNKGKKGKTGDIIYSKPVYIGYYCSRVVLEIGTETYVLHSQLIPITAAGIKISSTCGIKLEDEEVISYDI